MKKTIFHCVSNILLFTLFGLAFMHPFSSVEQSGESGFTATVSVFPVLFAAFLVIYPVLYLILKKSLNIGKKDMSELSFSDEREKIIVSEATKTAYITMITGLIGSVAIIGGSRFIALFTHQEPNSYFICVLLLTILLNLSTISYGIKWISGYRR